MLTAVNIHMDAVHDESMLSTPSNPARQTLDRQGTEYTQHDASFAIKDRVYSQQYAGIYFSRLNMLRPSTLKAAKERWGKGDKPPPHIPRVLDVQPGEVCYVVGTLYKDMPLKPNILDEVTQEHWVIAPPPRTKYTSEDDEAMLEDESGRLKLTGDFMSEQLLVTGVIVGLLGCENAQGEFEVIDICYPQLMEQVPIPFQSEENRYVAIVAGLRVGEDPAFNFQLQLLTDFLCGELGSMENQTENAQIVWVVVAGNSVAKLKAIEEEKKPTKNKYGAETASYNTEPLEAFDVLLSEICATVDVDLMPGELDPANCSLPQQPTLFALFPDASRYSTLHHVTNPHAFEVGGVSFLGTSGQTIDDIFKFVESEDRLLMAERTLQWAHLAPTAPDTLWCYPYKDTDPFVLRRRPHVYFIGNQPEFATTLTKDGRGSLTRIVLVPSFAQTGTIVLVNLNTLECKPVEFKRSRSS
ncbi:hypothetical protein HK104_011295 [Borealophlyctis nickersoniae]|nr:hypothetical protein HK104_011295 [Borealophlyctis nickersoniae]